MVSFLNASRDLLAVRPRALEAADVLAGMRREGTSSPAAISGGVGGAVCPQPVRADVFASIPGQLPGGHPA